jgi:hypothetical protein
MIQHFLAIDDAQRTHKALSKLGRHDLSRWALTGGFAVEIHHLRCGRPASIRLLNDLDFIAPGFDCAPETLSNDYLFRHVHPLDPPGKTILQLVDADAALRIDLFRAYGETMSRTARASLPSGPLQLVSIEDLVARTARLMMDLAEGVPVSAKHANDYGRLVELVDPSQVEDAWLDHRRATHPSTFREANTLIKALIAARRDLLITSDYSKDAAQICPRCVPHDHFQLADPTVVFSLLGYC